MRCPRLEELPPPPAGKTGWPWTEDASPTTATKPTGATTPKISIVGLSFNQAGFLEHSIRTVLLQNYPDIEYLIIDGGSTDESVAIIRKYEPWLAYWCSEKDRGPAHAVNKGLIRTTGQIMCWLASDDYYLPGTMPVVGQTLADGTGHYALAGHCLRVHDDGSPPALLKGHYLNRRRLLQFWRGYEMHAPSIFWRREVYEKNGLLDESKYFTNDFDYWTRVARHFDFVNVDRVLSCASYHKAALTGDDYASYRKELKKMPDSTGLPSGHPSDGCWNFPISGMSPDMEAE